MKPLPEMTRLRMKQDALGEKLKTIRSEMKEWGAKPTSAKRAKKFQELHNQEYALIIEKRKLTSEMTRLAKSNIRKNAK